MKSNILIEGEVGSGKTYALRTLLPEYTDHDGTVRRGAGKRTLLVSLEPGAEATLHHNLCRTRDDFGIHVHYIQPLAISWDDMAMWARIINSMPLEKALAQEDSQKRKCTQFMELLNTCKSFVCDRCGLEAGDAGELGDDTALALDGLSNLTIIARHLCVGLKPILSRPEYNPVMDTVENFLRLFWGGTKCSAILLAHIDREINPVSGMSMITVHTIGQKLAPRILKMPDETMLAEYEDGKYTWTTNLTGHILKTRNMPRATGLAPDLSAYRLFDATE